MFLKEGVSLQCNHSLDTSTYYLQVWLLLLWEIEEVQAAAEWQQQQHICERWWRKFPLFGEAAMCCPLYLKPYLYKFVAPWARSSVTYVCRYFCHNISIILLFVNDISNYLGMLLGIFKVLVFLKNLNNASHLIRSLVAD